MDNIKMMNPSLQSSIKSKFILYHYLDIFCQLFIQFIGHPRIFVLSSIFMYNSCQLRSNKLKKEKRYLFCFTSAMYFSSTFPHSVIWTQVNIPTLSCETRLYSIPSNSLSNQSLAIFLYHSINNSLKDLIYLKDLRQFGRIENLIF